MNVFEMLYKWSDQVWEALMLLLILLVVLVLCLSVISPKRVEFYYLQGSGRNTCVYGYINWYPDDEIACNSDPEKAVALLKQANETLVKERAK